MRQIVISFGTDIHDALRMNARDFGDPLTFRVACHQRVIDYVMLRY